MQLSGPVVLRYAFSELERRACRIKRSASRSLAIVSAAAVMMGATSAVARTSSFCFKVGYGGSCIAVGPQRFRHAEAAASSGCAVVYIFHYSQSRIRPRDSICLHPSAS